MMIMYRKILETDEAINDLSRIMFEAYNYTRDRNSGTVFLNLYDATITTSRWIKVSISYACSIKNRTGSEYLGQKRLIIFAEMK